MSMNRGFGMMVFYMWLMICQQLLGQGTGGPGLVGVDANADIVSFCEFGLSDTIIVDVSCHGGNDGSITVVLPDEFAPYTYNWSVSGSSISANTISNLSAGVYTLVITASNDCTIAASFLIRQPAPLEVTIDNFGPVICSDEPVDLSAQILGGTGDYAISWFDLIGTVICSPCLNADVSVAPGQTYCIEVMDENGCVATDCIEIIDQTAFTLDFQIATNPCANVGPANTGEIEVIVNTDVPGDPFLYAINSGDGFSIPQSSPVFSELYPGTYIIGVQNNVGCIVFDTLVLAPTSPIAVLPSLVVSDISCIGADDGAIEINTGNPDAVGGYSLDGVLFSTTNNFQNLAAGTYTVFISDTSGCVTTQFVEVIAPLDADVAVSTGGIQCFGETTELVVASTIPEMPDVQFTYFLDGVLQTSNVITDVAAGDHLIEIDDGNCIYEQLIEIEQPSLLAIEQLEISVPDCFGDLGEIVIVGTGGSGDYEYALNDSTQTQTDSLFSGLLPGTYEVFLLDGNGCVTSQEVIIDAPPSALEILAINVLPAPCFGDLGEIVIVGTGGLGEYEYALNDSTQTQTDSLFSGLLPGTYEVFLLDGNGCVTSQEVIIDAPPSALEILAINVLPAPCFGDLGEIVIVGTGGSGDYEYALNDSTQTQTDSLFTDLLPGTYEVFLLDGNGCVTSQEVIIDAPPSALEILAINVLPAPCFGDLGEIVIVGTGGSGDYEYALNDSTQTQTDSLFSDLLPDTYEVFLLDGNGCVTSQEVIIDAPPSALEILAINVLPAPCFGDLGEIVIVGTGGSGEYEYALNDSTQTQTDSLFTDLMPGIYEVFLLDGNGCWTSQEVIIDAPPSALEILAINVLPAPCFGDLGEIVIVGTGGSGDYEYALNDSTQTQNGQPV